MTPSGPSDDNIQSQLERVLASPLFARNERLSRFLRFVVESKLAGRGSELKETVLAVEVFARPPDYDPKRDATVRTEAGRLRSRLSEYYLSEGKTDPVIIELPRGGYVPAFRVGAGHEVLQQSAGNRQIASWIWPVALASVVLAGFAWRSIEHRDAPVTVGVLPFDNLNHDPADDYLADGLTDELIRTLTSFEGLATRSRASSLVLKGTRRSVREVGRDLDVEYLVGGSILRSGTRLRIEAQLVRVRDDTPIWSGRFDRELGDVITIQDDISRAVVNDLRIKLGRGRPRYKTNSAAYDLYLHARALDFRDNVVLFQKAIAMDPLFAPAYAGLAATYAYRTSTVYFNRPDEIVKMREAADKAIELDPFLAEAQDALGVAYARDGHWALAEKSFRRAMELEPNRSETYGDFAMCILLPLGRFDEALNLAQIAERSDPLSNETRQRLTWTLFATHRYKEAASQCGRLIEPFRSECLGRARLGQGDYRGAVDVLEAQVARGVKPGAQIRGYLAYAYAKAGRRTAAEEIADSDLANPFHQVLAYVGLGENDRAFGALEKMATQGPTRIGLALSGPEVRGLREDPRARALRQEVGLPEYR